MPKATPYNGRPLAELDALPDSAFISPAEFRAWTAISASTYHRHIIAGLIPAPLRAGPAKRLHRMADARTAFAAESAA